MERLGKIRHNGKLIQVLMTFDFKRDFKGIDSNNNYYNLTDLEYKELFDLFTYNNKTLYGEKGFKEEVKKILFFVSLLGLTTCAATTIQTCYENQLKNNLLYIDASTEDIIKNNKKLDDNSKQLLYNFYNTVKDNFDLTLFNANVEKLEIIYLNDDEFTTLLNERKMKSNVAAFFDISKHTIYVNNTYDFSKNLNHEFFHLVNNYYDDYITFYSYSTVEGKGNALLEGMTAEYTDQYFEDDSYSQERVYVKILKQILGKEKILYYYQYGTVENTITALKNLYGDEKKANKLIMMMDDNLENKEKMDPECYQENVEDIMDLFQNYFFGSQEKQIKEILDLSKDYDINDKKNLTKLLLITYFTNSNEFVYFYDENQAEIFYDKQVSSLSNVYNMLVSYDIYNSKEEFLNQLEMINDSWSEYSYNDIKNYLKANNNEKVSEENLKNYVKKIEK